MNAYSLESEARRREAEARMAMGGGFPAEFVSILRMQNASLGGTDAEQVSASIRGALAFAAAAKQMRRLFGSCGSAARQDVSVPADVDMSSEDENEHAA